MGNESLVYRFRSVEKILGSFQELEKQEIYFSTLEELNDPVEGFKNIFWQGDSIAWKNLLKHYLLCLERSCYFTFSRCDDELCSQYMPKMVFFTENDLLLNESRAIFAEICEAFFKPEKIKKYPETLSLRTTSFYKEELCIYLSNIHNYALFCIEDVYAKHGLINNISFSDKNVEKIISDVVEPVSGASPGIAKLGGRILLEQVKWFESQSPQRHILDSFMFAGRYLDALEGLLFGSHYVASFSNCCDNSSLWGHYGDGHKGVCLMFSQEVDEEGQDKCIELEFKNKENKIKYRFEPINYAEKYETVDFFRSMGVLINEKINWWFGDGQNVSDCLKAYNGDEWRKKYWDKSRRLNSTKLRDWEYEQESRLTLMDSFGSGSYSERANRKAKYELSSLHGIIFGIKTSMDDKLRIYEIIKRKCSATHRNDFKFYQAYYSESTGKIVKYELML